MSKKVLAGTWPNFATITNIVYTCIYLLCVFLSKVIVIRKCLEDVRQYVLCTKLTTPTILCTNIALELPVVHKDM